MSTIHAFFSPAAALIHGSAVYRKESGSTVNVTRTSAENEVGGFYRHTEKYLGQVIGVEEGGCVQSTAMVDGVTSHVMRASSRMRAKDQAARQTTEALGAWENEGGHR